MNRAERRQQARSQGKPWTWERKPTPREVGAQLRGWAGEIERIFANGKYAVQIHTVQTPWGPVEHAAISTLAGADIPWRDKQQIKNELFGAERVAVEVFPAESELIDGANMYHLWVLPVGKDLPFGLTLLGDTPTRISPG